MTFRSKQDGDKFEGKLGDSLYDVMAVYLKISNDLGLNHEQKRGYLHHLFCGETKRFCKTYVEGNQGIFAEACAAMTNEFISLTRQNRCHSLLMKITQL